MSEKFFDIIPPKKIKQTKTIKFQTGKKVSSFSQKNFNQKKKFFVLSLTVLIILGLGIIFYFILPRAEIIIWPETEIFKQEIVLTLDKEIEQVDFANKIIPARLITVEKNTSEEFLATGRIVERRKAEGIIRVYNIYSTRPLSLVIDTRFMSEDGKLFHTKRRITIPGAKREEGRLISRYIDVEVRAAVPGQEYNIPSDTSFSIPGLVGSPKFYGFYGKSYAPMEGGFKGEVSQVTQADLDKAKTTVLEKLFKDAEKAIKNKVPDGSEFILLNGQIIEHQIIEQLSSAKVGDKKDDFEFQAKIKSQAVTFNLSDIEKFGKEYILLNIQDIYKDFLENSLKINYSFKDIDLKQGKFTMLLEIEAIIFPKINQETIKENIKGKTIPEVEIFLQAQPEIIKKEINLWPFWVEKIPQNKEKIGIELDFN